MGLQRVGHDWVTSLSLSYLSLLSFGTLYSDGYIFPFLLCILILFLQLFVRFPQTAVLPFCISFSWGWSCLLPPVKWNEVKSLSCVRLFATPWTVAHHAPLSIGFSRQEYWSGLPLTSPGDLPNPGIKWSPAFQADAFTIWATSCTMSQTSVHSSSGTLSIRSNPLNLLLTSTV